MKFSPTTILSILLVALVTWNVRGCFTKPPVNEKAIRNDEKVKSLERERLYKDSVYNETIALKDSQISILSDKIINNKTSITQSNERIKTLPYRISSMSIDDLLRTIDQ